jgi:hypothetical protein
MALEPALVGFDAWITGRKRFQGGVRWQLPTIEPEWSRARIKINPLAPWSAEDVERYRILRGLPRHPLADRGFPFDRLRPVHAPGGAARAAARRPVVGLGQVRVRHPPDRQGILTVG